MDIESFLLCDAATDQQGKLNILGAFDTIYVKKAPAIHPACAVAVRIRFQKIEEGNHSIRIRIIDEDGKGIEPNLEGNINVKIGENRDSAGINAILNIQGLKFEKHGKYRVDLAIDGEIKASVPLRVILVP
jgi:hypothetical protein